jgi:hypothetical protein
MLNSYLSGEGATHKNRKCSLAHIIQEQHKGLEVCHTGLWLVENVELLVNICFDWNADTTVHYGSPEMHKLDPVYP